MGISGRNLSSGVGNCGGAGVIATVGLGLLYKERYKANYAERDKLALRDEIRAAREMSNGVLATNILYALSDFKELVEVSVEENVDMII